MDLSQWLEYIQRQHPESIELGLDRVREVATRLGLGRPAAQVITVAGTNGKGSTVAFIQAIAGAGGWKVGAYTSPHLLRYNERVRIEAEEVSDDALVAAFAAVEAARGDTPLTYFEFGTLAALWLFQRASLDLAVLEVGLGGRLDAVNLVDADVAVVTTVDIDHADWLGSDRESIGYEKAGIARAWKPLVLGEVDPPSSVLRHAYAIGAIAIRLGSDFFHEDARDQTDQPADVSRFVHAVFLEAMLGGKAAVGARNGEADNGEHQPRDREPGNHKPYNAEHHRGDGAFIMLLLFGRQHDSVLFHNKTLLAYFEFDYSRIFLQIDCSTRLVIL